MRSHRGRRTRRCARGAARQALAAPGRPARCATWPATWWRSPATGCARGRGAITAGRDETRPSRPAGGDRRRGPTQAEHWLARFRRLGGRRHADFPRSRDLMRPRWRRNRHAETSAMHTPTVTWMQMIAGILATPPKGVYCHMIVGHAPVASVSRNPGDPVVVRLRLIGQMEAWTLTSESMLPSGRKTRALLAVLALSAPRPVLRGKLAELLWSRRPEEQARASLRQEIHRLLEALAPAGRADPVGHPRPSDAAARHGVGRCGGGAARHAGEGRRRCRCSTAICWRISTASIPPSTPGWPASASGCATGRGCWPSSCCANRPIPRP